jgi:hypothetical protein
MHRLTVPTLNTWAALRWGISFVVMCAAFVAALLFADEREKARAAQSIKVEAETMTLSGLRVYVKDNAAASGGKAVSFSTKGSASSSFDGAPTRITLRARGTACHGNPQLKIYVDGALKGTVEITTSTFAEYTLALSGLSSGTHTLRVSFENDYYVPSTCDRNAYLDYYVLTLPNADPVLVGAGDIAGCDTTGDEATAKLLDGISGTVFTAGDNAYNSGTPTQFNNCYDPTWGRHKARTKPTPGNHEYLTAGASGYFGYFGSAAGDPSKGYYSYDLGEWHIVALNSMCEKVGGCGATSPMVSWLKQDLAANDDKACTLAYFHHPLFSSGSKHGNSPKMRPSWNALYAANAEVVLNGHDHDYERFAPQRPDGTLDNSRGIREFVVGTGGKSLRPFGTIKANSQVRNANTYGVLKLTLHPTSYEWKFVPEAGKTFTDSGVTTCH